jgi:PAS domain S-box-containing protein
VVSSDTFVEQLDHLQHRLAALWDQTDSARSEPSLMLEELGTAVEELNVAAAQLEDADRWIVEERTRYQQLFQLAPDAFLTTDVDGVIDEANRAAERLFKATGTHLHGKPLVPYVHPADRKYVHRALARLESGERLEPWQTWVLPGRESEPIPVEVHCTLHEHDQRSTVLWSLRDIRERVRADRLEREAADRRGRDLEEYASRIRRLEKAKSDFLDLASHELRGPLTVVRGYVSMISEGTLGPVSDRISSAMGIVSWKLDEMNRLISQMLDTARIEDDRLFLSPEPHDMRTIAGEAVRSLLPQAATKEQRIELLLPSSPVIAEVDRDRIIVVIANLVENALKYSPARTTVTCAVGARADLVRIAVSDQGPGLDPQALEVLFSRFGRVVAPETSDVPGTGLGLYLAREIARRHGGDVVAETDTAPGSTFSLLLPLARPSAV